MAEERNAWEKIVHSAIEEIEKQTAEKAEGKEVYKEPADIKTGYVNSASVAPITSDVAQVYEVLAPMAGDYMNAQAEQIGMAQQSMGPLAAAAMGQSQTAGLGNYTYNRIMRPQVDTMRDEIRVQGYANQLNKLLSDTLNRARNNYNKSGSGGNTTGTPKNSNTYSGEPEEEEKKENTPNGSSYNPNDSVKSGYKFDHMGNVPGYTGQYPLHVQTPYIETTYQDYTYKYPPLERGTVWVKFLKSLGYAG